MTRSKTRVLAVALVFCLWPVVNNRQTEAQPANVFTQYGSVQELEAGWVEDSIAVIHSASMVNPGGCPTTNGGYATNPNDGGYNLFHTLLLSAFLNRKEVSLLISGCVYGKSHIIAVKVY